MAWTSNTTSSEFGAGVNHVRNPGRENSASITLGGALQAAGDKWDAESQEATTSPHSVLSMYNFSRSANGSDGQNFLPNGAYLGNSNGMSEGDFDKNLSLRYAGGSSNLP